MKANAVITPVIRLAFNYMRVVGVGKLGVGGNWMDGGRGRQVSQMWINTGALLLGYQWLGGWFGRPRTVAVSCAPSGPSPPRRYVKWWSRGSLEGYDKVAMRVTRDVRILNTKNNADGRISNRCASFVSKRIQRKGLESSGKAFTRQAILPMSNFSKLNERTVIFVFCVF